MSPSLATSCASTPVSSRISRSAASAPLSSFSGWPLGSASTRSPPLARRVGTITMHWPSLTTTPPAEYSRSIGGRAVGPASEDIAPQRVGVVDGQLAPSLGDQTGAFEHGKEAAGRLSRRTGELGD